MHFTQFIFLFRLPTEDQFTQPLQVLECLLRGDSNGRQRAVLVRPRQRFQVVDEHFRIALHVALADLMLQPQFIRHRLEGIGIVANQQLGIDCLGDGF